MFFEILFLLSVGSLIYVYVGYPALAWSISRIRSRRLTGASLQPRVSVLIAAYNEKDVIESTIRNKLDQEYPHDKLEVVVVSDASTDGTDEIVQGFADDRLRLIVQKERLGKTMALNAGVAEATGEIIAFADANSMWAPDALKCLVQSFADREVGYATGKMVYTDPGGTVIGDGCSAYMRYENRLREWETRLGSVVGVDGGIDAVRRELYKPMRADQLPDFVLPLQVVGQGRRVVYEPRALLREPALRSSEDEYRMRVRVSLRSLWAIYDMRGLLNPFRHGIFSWQLLSHKVLRYGCFLFLAGALVSNLALWGRQPIWSVLLMAQLGGYAGILLFWLLDRAGVTLHALYLPYYFALVNLASAHAFLKFIAGRRQVLWTPRKG